MKRWVAFESALSLAGPAKRLSIWSGTCSSREATAWFDGEKGGRPGRTSVPPGLQSRSPQPTARTHPDHSGTSRLWLASFTCLAFIWAIEPQQVAAAIVVDSQADALVAGDGQCTLREAIRNANLDTDTTAGDCAAGVGPDRIEVPAGTYVLAIANDPNDADENDGLTGDLDVTGDLEISGAAMATTVIDGNSPSEQS